MSLTRWMLPLLALCGLGLGCDAGGGGSVGLGAFHAGTRLHPRVQVEQGAPANAEGLFVAWHDDELDVDCRFVRDVDGVYRCLPSESAGLRVYPSSTCEPGTGLLASFDPDERCAPRYVWYGYEATSCNEHSAGVALRVVGPATASLQTHPYVLSVFDSCNPRNAPEPPDPGPAWRYCEYEEVSSKKFVVARESIRKLGAVRQLVLRGDDGSVEPRALLHPDYDTVLVRDWWDGTQLVPGGPSWGVGVPVASTDSTCEQAALCFPDEHPSSSLDPVVTAPAECEKLTVIDDDACSGKVYELGARVDHVTWCDQPEPTGQPLACFVRQRVLPRIPYAEITVGHGRLRPVWSAQGGALAAPTTYFYDEQLETTCTPETTSDDRILCRPIANTYTNGPQATTGWLEHFADEQCETSLGFEFKGECGEAAPNYAHIVSSGLSRMRPAKAPQVAKTYSGFTPPRGHAIGCTPDTELPGKLFTAEPVTDDDLAQLEDVVR